MSSNPQCALDALLTPHPITLGQVALLEKIDSPLLKEGELLAADVIPSLYLLRLPASEAVGKLEHLREEAFRWADAITPEAYRKLQAQALEGLRVFFGMLPGFSTAQANSTRLSSASRHLFFRPKSSEL